MIAALLLRFGIPKWMAEVALLAALACGVVLYHHHVYAQGEAAADARAEAREKANSDLAKAEVAKLNEKVAKKQSDLDTVVADLIRTEVELSHEKRDSAALQSALAAGDKRMSVLVRQRPADPAKPDKPACPAAVGDGASTLYDLDGRVASDLEWARQTRDEAITRLNACIGAYNAARKAVNTPDTP